MKKENKKVKCSQCMHCWLKGAQGHKSIPYCKMNNPNFSKSDLGHEIEAKSFEEELRKWQELRKSEREVECDQFFPFE